MPIANIEPPRSGTYNSNLVVARGFSSQLYPRLDPNKCVTFKNMNITEQGTTKRRKGYAKYNTNQIVQTTAKDVVGILQPENTAGTSELLVVAGAKIYTVVAGATAMTDVTGTAEVADNTDARCRFVFIDNKVFATDGSKRPWTKAVSANAAILTSGAPFAAASGDYCKDFVVHRNMLLALHTKESGTVFPTRVRWCDIDRETYVIDPTVWLDANRYEVQDEGLPIVGATDNFDCLLVFKGDGLYPCRLYYDVGFIELRQVGVYKGFKPVARNSIISRPEFTWAIAKDGAYVVLPQGGSEDAPKFDVKKVTTDIDKFWKDSLAPARLDDAVSFIREGDHQVRTLMSSTTNTVGHDLVMVWDWISGDVWFDEPYDAFNYAISFDIAGVEYDCIGTDDGYVMQGNYGATDNGENINWDIQFGPNNMEIPGKAKTILSVDIDLQKQAGTQSVTMEAILNQGRVGTFRQTLDLGSTYTYDSGLKYDTGLKYPGGTNRRQHVFINRNAEIAALRLYGSDAIELVSHAWEFAVEE